MTGHECIFCKHSKRVKGMNVYCPKKFPKGVFDGTEHTNCKDYEEL